MTETRIVGREASHFTRVARIVAHELGVPIELSHVPDLTSLEPSGYAGHPGLKIPALVRGDEVLFGAENVCRRLSELAYGRAPKILWPEGVTSTIGRNAQELVLHAMSAEVTLVLAPGLGKVATHNPFVVKVTRGLSASLAWLDQHLDAVLGALPPGELSFLEVSLFCLVEHVAFRRTVPLDGFPQLAAFVSRFGERESAKATPYRYVDAPPEGRARPGLRRPALDPRDVAARTTSAYPLPFRDQVLPREKRALGDALGLSRVGVNLTTLFPGKRSALRHYHSHEEELVFVLEGEVVLRTDEGEQVLRAGTCAGFPAGSTNGHHLENRAGAPARYLEIGTRERADVAGYPDDDLAARKDDRGIHVFTHKDGSPY